MNLRGEWRERLHVDATAVSAVPSLGLTMTQALAMCMKKTPEYSTLQPFRSSQGKPRLCGAECCTLFGFLTLRIGGYRKVEILAAKAGVVCYTGNKQ